MLQLASYSALDSHWKARDSRKPQRSTKQNRKGQRNHGRIFCVKVPVDPKPDSQANSGEQKRPSLVSVPRPLLAPQPSSSSLPAHSGRLSLLQHSLLPGELEVLATAPWSLLMGSLFSCLRSNAGADADDAYTCIVDVKDPSPPTSVSIPTRRGSHLRHPTGRTTSSDLLIDFDEKHLNEDERTPSSSQSSIVSVPSTFVTILTSSRNGAAASDRQSYASSTLGPPPSYHSRRTVSPCPSDETIPEHPVMARAWLERLQNQAHADMDPFRDGSASLL